MHVRFKRVGAGLGLVLLASATQTLPTNALCAPAGQSTPAPEGRYIGPDGGPLPFVSDEEVLDFLRTAEVVERTPSGAGINNPDKLLLERDGVRAHAVFRDVAVEMRRKRVGDRFYFLFRDNYLHEIGAYVIAQLFEVIRERRWIRQIMAGSRASGAERQCGHIDVRNIESVGAQNRHGDVAAAERRIDRVGIAAWLDVDGDGNRPDDELDFV